MLIDLDAAEFSEFTEAALLELLGLGDGETHTAGETKREQGEDFPAAAYAYVPDASKPSTWKLRLWESLDKKVTARQVGMAVAALGKGFRGRKVQIPSDDLPKVKAKVRSAWKKVHDDDEELPPVLKANASTQRRTHEDLYIPTPVKLEKAAEVVQYRMADDGQSGDMMQERCGSCRFYAWRTCNLVEGTIEADHVCDLYQPTPVAFAELADLCGHRPDEAGEYRLFIQEPRLSSVFREGTQ